MATAEEVATATEEVIFEEVLIGEVQKYDHLYKVRSNNFKDVERASNSWQEISKTLHQIGLRKTSTECKKKWKYLRDTFFRYRRDSASKSGDAAKKMVKWKYFDALTFLADSSHCNKRAALSSLPVQSPPEEESDPVAAEEIVSEENDSYTLPKTTPISLKKSRKSSGPDSFETTQKAIVSCLELWTNKQKKAAENVVEDNTSSFAQHVNASLRNLGALDQSRAKFEIQQVLFKYEQSSLGVDIETPESHDSRYQLPTSDSFLGQTWKNN